MSPLHRKQSMNKLIFALLFVVLPASAKSLSFKGMSLQLVDKNQAPIKNMKADFALDYYITVFDLSCLFTSGAPVGNPSFFCSASRMAKSDIFSTDENGIIDMSHWTYRKLGAQSMTVRVKFDSTATVKCPNINYFRSEMTGDMVLDSSIRLTQETVDKFRAAGKKTFICILE